MSSNDLLAAWYADPDVTAAALYLESFGNSAKFARFARRFAERKPLLAVVGGRSAGGSRAGASHTAAAASPGVGVDALFAQAGVIGCRDAEDLARTAKLLAEQPLPSGRRLAILSNAGGMGVLAADAAAAEGLEVPEFSPALQERLAALVHGTTGTSNPVDAGAGVSPAQLADLLDTMLDARARWTPCSSSRSPPASPTAARRCPSSARVRADPPRPSGARRPLGWTAGTHHRRTPDHLVPDHCLGSARRWHARCGTRVAGGPATTHRGPTRSWPYRYATGPVNCSPLPGSVVVARGGGRRCLSGYHIEILGSVAGSASAAVSAARRLRVPGGDQGDRLGRRAQDRAWPRAHGTPDPTGGPRRLSTVPRHVGSRSRRCWCSRW